MSHPPTSRRRATLALALAGALLLRALVPAGYMPAPVSSGWPVQLCPDGLAGGAALALLGDAHAHHHHELRHQGGDAAPQDGALVIPQPCELGAGFALAAAVGNVAGVARQHAAADLETPPVAAAPVRRLRPAFEARAPPHLLS